MHRRPRLVLVAAGLCALAPLAAGCGGGSATGVASVAASTTTSSTGEIGLVGYSRCMRSNGVSTFPDPASDGGIPKPQVIAAAQANPNAFKNAAATCGHLLPDGSLGAPQTAEQIRTRVADALSFAHCMRGRGVARFPDPTAQGELSIAMVEAQGIDMRSPQVLRDAQACVPASHGWLTPAKVAQAVHDAGA
jgi:hypothetical protein